MNSITTKNQQDNPGKLSQLEYARMIEQAHGPQAPVTWLSVGELVDLLELAEVGARVRARTGATIRRIAELRIQAHNLPVTVDEYLGSMQK